MTARKPSLNMEQRVLEFILTFRKEHGFAPTISEIADGVYMSRSGVTRYLDKLEAHGRIWREQRRPRALRILVSPDGDSAA